MDRLINIALIAATAVSAWLAWYGPGWVACAPLAFVFWLLVRSRWAAVGIGLAYYGVAYACLPGTLDGFFHQAKPGPAWLLVAGFSMLLSLVWGGMWARRPVWWRPLLLVLVLTVPPVGLAHLWNPLFGVAAWLPGWGLAGLAVFTLCLMASVRAPWLSGAAMVVAVVVAHVSYVPPSPLPGWVAVDTAQTTEGYGQRQLGAEDDMRQFRAIEAMLARARQDDVRVLVLPESHLANVTDPRLGFFERDWQRLADMGKTVLVGYSAKHEGTNINVVGAFGLDSFLWQQRFPALGAMWRPWDRAAHYPMRLGHPYLAIVDSRPTTVAMCFEAGILWPLVSSQLHDPHAYIAVGNLSWGRSTNLNRQGRLVVAAWAQLAGLPYVLAINE